MEMDLCCVGLCDFGVRPVDALDDAGLSNESKLSDGKREEYCSATSTDEQHRHADSQIQVEASP